MGESSAQKGRVALVTGGARGIGLGISRKLLADGFDLAICGMKESSAVQEVMDDLAKSGRRVEYIRADISSKPDRENLVAEVKARFGALHTLVNNAGVAPDVRADILEASEDSFDKLIRVNLKGPYFLTQLCANWMAEQKRQAPQAYWGCIINVTSVSSILASTNRGDYCLSKAALSMSTSLWAARMAQFGVPVYEIRPGIIRTDMTAGVTEKYDKLIADGLLPLARWGTPMDVGDAASMLARGNLPYSTGQVLHVDGGLTLQVL